MRQRKRKLKSQYNSVRRYGLDERLSDLGKQAIFLMGLPGAGKSTFINNELPKYIPIRGFRTTSSDSQVIQLQYETAMSDYNMLLSVSDNEDDFYDALDTLTYVTNTGKQKSVDISYEEFLSMRNAGEYYNLLRKPYYATYFVIRPKAQAMSKDLLVKKAKIGGEMGLVFDGTAANPDKIKARLERTKSDDYKNTIFFLDIPAEISVQRDIYRGKTHGRTVGSKTIYRYVSQLKNAIDIYTKNPKYRELIDIIYHFKWIQYGDSPIEGHWELIKKYDFEIDKLKRKLR